MKTKEQYFRDETEKEKKEAEERRVKWTQEIMEEIKEWDSDRLEDEYIKVRLARISYCNPVPMGCIWDWSKDKCRFCGLEYTEGHENCCDDCWDKNKKKTLEELE